MSELSQKCENYPIFKQNYTLELIIALKMAFSCCSGLRGNLDFPDFLQQSFITSTTGRTFSSNGHIEIDLGRPEANWAQCSNRLLKIFQRIRLVESY